jgi:hypothetical protein
LDIGEDIKKKRMEWLEHTVKIEHGSIFKESRKEGR